MPRALTITAVALAASCGSEKPTMPRPPSPLNVVTASAELPADLAAATLKKRGLAELVFATASADGHTVGLMFESEAPGVVAVVRVGDGGGLSVEQRAGNLVPGTSPLIGRTDGEEVRFDELVEGTEYRAPARIGAKDGSAWTDGETLWRLAASKPGAGLLRAVTNRELTWSAIDFHTAGDAMPRWHVEHLPGGAPSFIADAVLSHDATRAIVQLTDGKGAARLVAYDTASGGEAWAVDTAPTYGYWGALLLSDDGATVATVLSDPSRCETCEKIEVRDVATGAKVTRLQLDPKVNILARLGPRGVETYLGIARDELWFRFRRGPQHADSGLVEACTYDVFELGEGTVRPTDQPWRAAFADCANLLLALPVQGGVLGVRVVDARRFEVLRFDRAP
jgi:hypothetical protein